MTRNPAIASLLAQLDEAFDRRSWHGTNLRGSLRGMGAAKASWRPGAGAAQRLGDRRARGVLEVRGLAPAHRREARVLRAAPAATGSRAPAPPTEAAWRRDVALLGECHRQLRAAVARLADGDLDRRAPGGKETVGRLVRGIAAHDLYHAGQIQLLKRMMR